MSRDVPGIGAGDRLLVVSPHLDDAVLSLGATIARVVRGGTHVTVLTVLACDPDSSAPTEGWDARAGFATEGEAARSRRAEDAAACAELGATARWLPYGSVDFERHGDDAEIAARARDALDDADAIVVPGTPLTHPDHEWLVSMLLGSGLPDGRVGFYVEQPYSVRALGAAGRPTPPHWLREALPHALEFVRLRAGARDWLAKRRAIRCYRSQLGLLGLAKPAAMRLERHLFAEARAGGEAVAWLPWDGPGSP